MRHGQPWEEWRKEYSRNRDKSKNPRKKGVGLFKELALEWVEL